MKTPPYEGADQSAAQVPQTLARLYTGLLQYNKNMATRKPQGVTACL